MGNILPNTTRTNKNKQANKNTDVLSQMYAHSQFYKLKNTYSISVNVISGNFTFHNVLLKRK